MGSGRCFSDSFRGSVGAQARRESSGPGSCPLEFWGGGGVTLGSARLYDLATSYIPDVLGLRARRPEAAVVKVMLRKDNRFVRVLIPDENVGHQGFHDVLLHDMANADAPYVAVSDLSALHQDWPAVVISGMTRHQLELDQCDSKKRYRGTQIGLCTFCGKVIRLDLARHVANYHLELAQLWRCPVSWYIIWKGTPQDCVYHIRLAHVVSAMVKVANVGSHHGQFPGISGAKP